MTWRRMWGLTPGEFTWLAVGLLLLGYELYAVAARSGHDVLTRAYRANVLRWWTWPVMTGILMGHLHGPVWPGVIGNRWSPVIFIVLLAGVVVRDLFVRTPMAEGWGQLGLFGLGLAVGVVSWVGRP